MVAACSRAAAPPVSNRCTSQPFALESPVPEASGAAWLSPGLLLVAGDSGNHGAYAIVDANTGATVEQGLLPLGDSSDDIEGLAALDGTIYGIVAPGWIYAWRRVDHGFELVDGPYALGPVDLPKQARGAGDKPPVGDGMVCDAHGVNCGRNYEGICLAPQPTSDGCAGYVAAKADGHLYCVAFDANHHLAVRRDNAIAVDEPGRLADCTYDDAGTLWAADNLFGLAEIFRIERGSAEPFAAFGPGFPEVLAVRGEMFYRMSDLGAAPSLMAKFRCPAVTK